MANIVYPDQTASEQSALGLHCLLIFKYVAELRTSTVFFSQNLGCDFNLSNKQSADVVAFICMMEEKLLPALVS